MKPSSIVVAVLAATLCLCAPASASTVVDVSGTDDLYLSGQPDGTACCYFDSAPTESPILAPLTLVAGDYLVFSTTGGAAHQPGPVYATADGDTADPLYNLHADYGTGISGPTSIRLGGLAGVFLGANTPTGSAPAQLSGTDFGSISPGLDQIFYIGDGLTGTGSGSIQTFLVPSGATRLFLGVTDDGGYYDNSGEITATISTLASAAPEPSTWAMILVGIGGTGGVFRQTRRKRSLISAETA